MTAKDTSYHLTAIAGHLREAGADWADVVVSLPERQWLKLATRLKDELGNSPMWRDWTIGRKKDGPREFQFHGIKYRSLG